MTRAALARYATLGYTPANAPTAGYIKKLDTFIRAIEGYGFISGTSSPLLEFLYFFWPDAASVDFGRINIVRPSFAACTGSPGFLANRGIGNAGGSLDSLFNWDAATGDAITGMTFNDINLGVYLKTAAASANSQEFTRAAGTNTRLAWIRHRMAQNRIDTYLGLTSASPTTIQAGASVSNRVYGIQCRAAVAYSYIDGTESASATGNATPDDTSKFAENMAVGAYLGAAWAGRAFTTTQVADWNTAIQAFSASL
jgi:hypothetical protein